MSNSKHKTGWVNQAELLLLLATAVISFLIALLDFIGALDSIPWLSDRIPTLTLLAVGLIASYIALERRNGFEAIFDALRGLFDGQKDSTRLIIDSLKGLEIRSFDTQLEFLDYFNQRLSQAMQQIDDISLFQDNRINRETSVEHFDTYLRVKTDKVKRIQYKELLKLNSSYTPEILKLHVAEAGYWCAYFEHKSDIAPQRFMIIDDEEVIIFGNLPTSNLAIRHPRIVRLFKEHFEEIWQGSWKLKYPNNVLWDRVSQILGDDETNQLYERISDDRRPTLPNIDAKNN